MKLGRSKKSPVERELTVVSEALNELARVSAMVGRELQSGSGQPTPVQLATMYQAQQELADALDGIFVRFQTRGVTIDETQHQLYSEAVSTFNAILLGHRLAELQRSGFTRPFAQLLAEVQKTYVRRV
jgi:hypothetical protein